MARVAPVSQGGPEVHEGSILHAAGDFAGERVVLALGRVECLVEILPGRPGHTVCAAEAVRNDAESVEESGYADGAAAVSLLLNR